MTQKFRENTKVWQIFFVLSVIGGHGFLDKGGVYTLGVSEKNFAAASGARTTGVWFFGKFFNLGCVGVHRGVNFRKNLEF